MGLTVEQIRQHVSSDLGDEALQRLLDSAEADIVSVVGAAGSVIEYHDGGLTYITLGRRVDPDSPVTITESWDSTTPVVVDDDDWRLSNDGRAIRRIDTGTNPRLYWYPGPVKVEFTAVDDDPVRDRVQIALVKLDLQYSPLISQESIDGYAYQQANNSAWNYGTERDTILSTLVPQGVGFA